MKTSCKNYVILSFLGLLFILPGATAYYVFKYHRASQLIMANITNKGELLSNHNSFPVIANGRKWQLIFWNPEECDKNCVLQLDKLAKIRLALGRRLFEVECRMLVDPNSQAVSEELAAMFAENDIQVEKLTLTRAKGWALISTEPKVYIADKTGRPLLAYPLSAKSEDIFHDLKQLL